MNDNDVAFVSSVAANYDKYLVPMLFEPYALDLAQRLASLQQGSVLETACGTGAMTQALRKALPPGVSIVATDLTSAMLEIAAKRVPSGVTFQQANAQELPFADNSFDVVVCQFGVMFYPDKALGFREAFRVLRPGGTFLFNVWDHLPKNKLSFTFARAIEEALPDIAPCFISRVPFSCGDYEPLLALLCENGFVDASAQTLEKTSAAESLSDVTIGLGEGSPLRAEIFARPEAQARSALDNGAHAIDLRYGRGPIAASMSAHVISAKKPT